MTLIETSTLLTDIHTKLTTRRSEGLRVVRGSERHSKIRPEGGVLRPDTAHQPLGQSPLDTETRVTDNCVVTRFRTMEASIIKI